MNMLKCRREGWTAATVCLSISVFTLLPHASLSLQQQEPVRYTDTTAGTLYSRIAAAPWPDLRA